MTTTKPLKVKDLPENEQKELLQKMSAARLPGIHTEYKVETATAKLGVNKEQTPATDEQNRVNTEQKPNSDEQNGVNENSEKENINNDIERNECKNQKENKNLVEKSSVCHICYGTVVKGVCQKCGYKYKG